MDENLVRSGDGLSWIYAGSLQRAEGPVHYVEFRSNELRVHLEPNWAKGWARGLGVDVEMFNTPDSAEYEEEEADFIGHVEAGDVIDRLFADDSIGDLWDGLTIHVGPLDDEPKRDDPHDGSGCKMVLIWRRTTSGPVLMWGGPSQDSYDALDRLLGYLVSEPEGLPPGRRRGGIRFLKVDILPHLHYLGKKGSLI